MIALTERIDWSKIKHFKQSEFACRCCGKVLIDKALLLLLDKARELLGRPISLTSAYRCTGHNAEVGGKRNSSHLTGNAVDIRIRTDNDRFELIKIFLELGITRLGVGKSLIHVDNDATKPPCVIWTYKY